MQTESKSGSISYEMPYNSNDMNKSEYSSHQSL